MDCLRLPGTSPDLHHTVCNISDSLHYLIVIVPLTGNGTCLLRLTWRQLWIKACTTLNHQLETTCVSLPCCKHLSDNHTELLWGLAHITGCSFYVILKAHYKLRATSALICQFIHCLLLHPGISSWKVYVLWSSEHYFWGPWSSNRAVHTWPVDHCWLWLSTCS